MAAGPIQISGTSLDVETQIHLEIPDVTSIQKSLSQDVPDDLSWIDRFRLLFNPIQKWENKQDGINLKTVITVSPEGFRMLFYIYFVFFVVTASVMTTIWSDLDLEDNPIFERYNYNNICVMFDTPPFTYVGCTLWIPNVFLMVFYLVFDIFRVRDAHKAGQLRTGYYRGYLVVTVFEIFAFCHFTQVFATTPYENMYGHTMPFMILIIATWTIPMKRYLWFVLMGRYSHYPRWYYYAAWTYVGLMLISATSKILVTVPNLFKAQLWTISGLEWTGTYAEINDRVYTFLVIICPPIIYYMMAQDIDLMVFTIVREETRRQQISK